MESTRVDRWIWAVRLVKTRSLATDVCKGGHVKVNGASAKPATTVTPGDRVEARVHGRDRVLDVVEVIDKRVGAPVAERCYVDHSPPPSESDDLFPLFERERGTGRPTKRDRRQLDRFRSR